MEKNENNVFGHVLSIAVSQDHRGKSIAKELMDFMHIQFATSYDVDNIDLYCRVSIL
jgi:ribosomal protein S18 acetylase RimI-like enzyme